MDHAPEDRGHDHETTTDDDGVKTGQNHVDDGEHADDGGRHGH